MESGGITPDTHPPYPFFSGKEGGWYLEQNFFIRDFLTKKFSGASRRRKRRGGVSGRGSSFKVLFHILKVLSQSLQIISQILIQFLMFIPPLKLQECVKFSKLKIFYILCLFPTKKTRKPTTIKKEQI